MKYEVISTSRFKKDLKLMVKRGVKMNLLEEVVNQLAGGKELPEKNKDHALTGNWVNHRECHVLSDWLLIRLLT